MNNTAKKSIFIISLLVIFIICAVVGIKMSKAADDSQTFKSQSIQASTAVQPKIDAAAGVSGDTGKADVNTSQKDASIQPEGHGANVARQTARTDAATSGQNTNNSSDTAGQGTNTVDVQQNAPKTCVISIQAGDKTILSQTSAQISGTDTVFDVLKRITREKGIQMEGSGIASSVYIKGIDNLYEFDRGSQSGWLYSVDGVFPSVGCGAYKLNGGEVIRWVYTINGGQDVGGKIEK